ncbi:MAG TPA: CHAD domain-containing protein [Flavipsychrobacter sp.]|nr:CHAD domain-containing protein [Flavipsychrobacter sp.]
MRKEKLLEILEKDVDKLADLSKAVSPTFDEEYIHKLRTQTKRFRALLRLITTDEQQPDVKLSKQYKDLYHIAGNIRDAQLMRQRIDKWKVRLPTYLDKLHGNIDLQKHFWEKHYDKEILKKLKDKITDHKFQTLNKETFKKFFNRKLKNICEVVQYQPNNEQIHEYRKEVKDMMYNMKFAENDWQEAYGMLKHFPSKELNELSDVLGAYNDDRIMLDKITHFSSIDMDEDERDAVKDVTKEGLEFLEDRKGVVLERLKKFALSAPQL